MIPTPIRKRVKYLIIIIKSKSVYSPPRIPFRKKPAGGPSCPQSARASLSRFTKSAQHAGEEREPQTRPGVSTRNYRK